MGNFFSDNDDLRFHFDRALDWPRIVRLTEYGGRAPEAHADPAEAVAAYRDVVELVGELAAEEIAPRALRIDREGGPRLEGGEVVDHPATREIIEKVRATGLHRMCLPRELGGMNAPVIVYMINSELLARADASYMTHHAFYGGIAMALLAYSLYEGTTEVDASGGRIVSTRFAREIEELSSGAAWGCMDITEPDAGSDMAALRTVAVEERPGEWRVSGQKIFITSGHGKHHLLIARTEQPAAADDPFAGLAGLSMFLVNAYDETPGGGRARHVTIDRIEEKLGHHGSATCALTFDRAPARLIGKRGEGFKYMLLLMNNARVAVGFESLGLCEAAYRMAAAYAEGRRSMGKPIARHEMIADYLDEMRTDLQALRALAMHAAMHEEASRKLDFFGRFATDARPDERAELEEMAAHQARARRATPLLKYLAAEKAVEMARRNVQIHGGAGYTRDYGAERLLRDAVVMPIYEGTSQIQALMAMKDTLGGIVKRPQAYLARRAQARWRSLRGTGELGRRVARLQELSLSAQFHLLARTAQAKLRTLADVSIGGWAQAMTSGWDPKRDFALAMLHAERLTRLLADELIAEVLHAQARRFPERRELLERFLDRAEPRARMLHDEITTTGHRLLSSLSAATLDARGAA
jgi:alkylation response protein AidB-like acyl-CoA dehydrogenase